jgi:hypothetical protein
MNELKDQCIECGRVMSLNADAQAAVLSELTQPSHAKIIECPCGRYQFALSARPTRRGKIARDDSRHPRPQSPKFSPTPCTGTKRTEFATGGELK